MRCPLSLPLVWIKPHAYKNLVRQPSNMRSGFVLRARDPRYPQSWPLHTRSAASVCMRRPWQVCLRSSLPRLSLPGIRVAMRLRWDTSGLIWDSSLSLSNAWKHWTFQRYIHCDWWFFDHWFGPSIWFQVCFNMSWTTSQSLDTLLNCK